MCFRRYNDNTACVSDDTMITWTQLKDALLALRNVVKGLERFLQAKAKTKGIDHNMHTVVCCLDQCNVSTEVNLPSFTFPFISIPLPYIPLAM